MSVAFLEGSEYEQATQTYKSTLADIEAGDMVVIHENGWNSGYSLRKVDRVTKTQIVVGNKKFNRNGNQIDSGSKWHKDYIQAPQYKLYGQRTMLEMAEADTADRIEKAKRTELTKTINDSLGSASIETLERIVEILSA